VAEEGPHHTEVPPGVPGHVPGPPLLYIVQEDRLDQVGRRVRMKGKEKPGGLPGMRRDAVGTVVRNRVRPLYVTAFAEL